MVTVRGHILVRVTGQHVDIPPEGDQAGGAVGPASTVSAGPWASVCRTTQ